MKPILTGFSQLAYSTNDIDHAMDLYDRKYGVSSFYRLDVELAAVVFGTEGTCSLKIGLANVEGVQIELIEPVTDIADFFGAGLKGKAEFTLALHHVCQPVTGDIANWEAHLADLGGPDRPIVCSALGGDYARIVFTDDRALLGAYIEHIWMTPEAWQDIRAKVPFNRG